MDFWRDLSRKKKIIGRPTNTFSLLHFIFSFSLLIPLQIHDLNTTLTMVGRISNCFRISIYFLWISGLVTFLNCSTMVLYVLVFALFINNVYKFRVLVAQALSRKSRKFMIYVHSKGMIVDDEYVILGVCKQQSAFNGGHQRH